MKAQEAFRHLLPIPAAIPHFHLKDDGTFPNSSLPLLHYTSILKLPPYSPRIVEAIFRHNGWTNSWRNGIYNYHHYHSTTHEVIGIYAGSCEAQIGGDSGIQIHLDTGDVLIIPAGVAHRCVTATEDFRCIGAYPEGRDFDINTGGPGERPTTDGNIKKLPLPKLDPLYGKEGHLLKMWYPG
jgi:uncharacterized protein YjlB